MFHVVFLTYGERLIGVDQASVEFSGIISISDHLGESVQLKVRNFSSVIIVTINGSHDTSIDDPVQF